MEQVNSKLSEQEVREIYAELRVLKKSFDAKAAARNYDMSFEVIFVDVVKLFEKQSKSWKAQFVVTMQKRLEFAFSNESRKSKTHRRSVDTVAYDYNNEVANEEDSEEAMADYIDNKESRLAAEEDDFVTELRDQVKSILHADTQLRTELMRLFTKLYKTQSRQQILELIIANKVNYIVLGKTMAQDAKFRAEYQRTLQAKAAKKAA